MKYQLFILFLLISVFNLSAQIPSDWTKFEEIKNISETNPAALSAKITAPYSDELDKIKAIYFWVTNNIKYDIKRYENRHKKKPNRKKYTPAEIQDKKENEVLTALKKKRGVCQEYSRVLQSLCQHADIKAEFVGGWNKVDPIRHRKMGGSHAWNLVQYEGAWHYIDATFGSGSSNQKGKFEFKFNPVWFMADVPNFELTHFPKDEKYIISEPKVEKLFFENHPWMSRGALTYEIRNLSPTNKLISPKGKDIIIRFSTQPAIKELRCYNLKKRTPIEIEWEEKQGEYTVTISSDHTRTGYFVFVADKTNLFTYRIQK